MTTPSMAKRTGMNESFENEDPSKNIKANDEADFWDALNSEDQAAIDEGIQQLDSGQYVSYEAVREGIKRKFNF